MADDDDENLYDVFDGMAGDDQPRLAGLLQAGADELG